MLLDEINAKYDPMMLRVKSLIERLNHAKGMINGAGAIQMGKTPHEVMESAATIVKECQLELYELQEAMHGRSKKH